MNTVKLVLMRHGESEWNKLNNFTGWVDIDLSSKGKIQAKKAGKILKDNGFIFDFGYTSMLKRAIRTLWIVLDQLDQMWLSIEKSWCLNERHYGNLQGLNKNEAIQIYGFDQINQWRRGFNDIPPKISKEKQFHIENDPRYKNLNIDKFPKSESLLLTLDRVKNYWFKSIEKNIKKNKSIIIVAHGNSIRAIVKFLNNLSDKEIFKINIPTGIPLVYEFDKYANPIKSYYLHHITKF